MNGLSCTGHGSTTNGIMVRSLPGGLRVVSIRFGERNEQSKSRNHNNRAEFDAEMRADSFGA